MYRTKSKITKITAPILCAIDNAGIWNFIINPPVTIATKYAKRMITSNAGIFQDLVFFTVKEIINTKPITDTTMCGTRPVYRNKKSKTLTIIIEIKKTYRIFMWQVFPIV